MASLNFTDILLLLAILVSGEEATSLPKVVSAIDAIDRTVLTHREIEGGFFRLSGESLVVVSEQTIRPTKLALKLYRAVQAKTSNWHEARAALAKELSATQHAPSPGSKTTYFTSAEYESAVTQHRQQAREFGIQSLQKLHGVSREEAERMAESAMEAHRKVWPKAQK